MKKYIFLIFLILIIPRHASSHIGTCHVNFGPCELLYNAGGDGSYYQCSSLIYRQYKFGSTTRCLDLENDTPPGLCNPACIPNCQGGDPIEESGVYTCPDGTPPHWGADPCSPDIPHSESYDCDGDGIPNGQDSTDCPSECECIGNLHYNHPTCQQHADCPRSAQDCPNPPYDGTCGSDLIACRKECKSLGHDFLDYDCSEQQCYCQAGPIDCLTCDDDGDGTPNQDDPDSPHYGGDPGGGDPGGGDPGGGDPGGGDPGGGDPGGGTPGGGDQGSEPPEVEFPECPEQGSYYKNKDVFLVDTDGQYSGVCDEDDCLLATADNTTLVTDGTCNWVGPLYYTGELGSNCNKPTSLNNCSQQQPPELNCNQIYQECLNFCSSSGIADWRCTPDNSECLCNNPDNLPPIEPDPNPPPTDQLAALVSINNNVYLAAVAQGATNDRLDIIRGNLNTANSHLQRANQQRTEINQNISAAATATRETNEHLRDMKKLDQYRNDLLEDINDSLGSEIGDEQADYDASFDQPEELNPIDIIDQNMQGGNVITNFLDAIIIDISNADPVVSGYVFNELIEIDMSIYEEYLRAAGVILLFLSSMTAIFIIIGR